MDPLSHSYYRRHPQDTAASPSHPFPYIRINQARPRGQLRRLIWHEPERAVPCSTSLATFIDLSPRVSPFSPFNLLIPRAESCVYGSSVRDASLFVVVPGRDSESLRVLSLSVPSALFVTLTWHTARTPPQYCTKPRKGDLHPLKYGKCRRAEVT